MSEPLNDNDNEPLDKRNPLSMESMSMKELVARRKSAIATHRTRFSGVVAVNTLDELANQLPEVKTEADVEGAADFLVGVFQAPRSKAFYCDCVRHIRDREFLKRAIILAFGPKVKNPAAYFGRICTNRLVKLGVYK